MKELPNDMDYLKKKIAQMIDYTSLPNNDVAERQQNMESFILEHGEERTFQECCNLNGSEMEL